MSGDRRRGRASKSDREQVVVGIVGYASAVIFSVINRRRGNHVAVAKEQGNRTFDLIPCAGHRF